MIEQVILVDKNDVPIGEMEKMEAHKKAKLHRAVSVFIFNSKGQVLLQKRALDKYHSAGLWTNAACTHPRPNESNKDAALRRLHEEMGIKIDALTKLFDFVYNERIDNELTEYEFDHVFVGITDNLPVPDPKEVCDYKYVDADKILGRVHQAPEKYTVWFKKIIDRVLSKVQCMAKAPEYEFVPKK